MSNKIFELAILGGGPAGAAAGVYAARKELDSILITEEFGGQSTDSPDIQNWIGTPSISGDGFREVLKEHVTSYAGESLKIEEGTRVEEVRKTDDYFEIETTKQSHKAKTVLVATGAHRRKLDIPGAKEFEGKGVVYCASCDGPLFADMDVVVIGGGNAGFETAAQLLNYAKSVTLLQRSDRFKADEITVKKVLEHPNMTALLNTEPTEVKGDNFVNSLSWKNSKTGETGQLDIKGVFVEIGLVPNTDLVKGLVELDDYNRIKIDFKNQRASEEGIWVAGDASNILYHQNNIAAGDAVRALEDIYLYCKVGSK